ncbi:snoRNA-binding rRNA-processing protein [Nowakowskiella sp. JEL0407]|nr:snoRNA-binding rRNA-processing protein [Nowakowskiella sp. JEL0407]
MGDFKPLVPKQFPRTGIDADSKAAEQWHWKKFKSPVYLKEHSSITHVCFSPAKPYDFAVTSSSRVQLYNSKTNAVKRTITRFKDTAYSASFRDDGKLIVAGDGTGLVQIFDANSRAVLRTLTGHDGTVRTTRFSSLKTQIISGGEDKTVRLWDIPSASAISVLSEHEDYIRSVSTISDNPHLILSGSYDHTVKLWDSRSNTCVSTMNHAAPVESIVPLPGGSLVASSGGNQIKVWDLTGGGRVLAVLSNSQKTVTSLTLDGSGTRLLSGSLDRHVKVYSLQDYRVLFSMKYPDPILSVAISADDSKIAVGMATGLLATRQRPVKLASVAAVSAEVSRSRLRPAEYFIRGTTHKPDDDDAKVALKKRKKLKPFDKHLKKFEYSKALDSVLLGPKKASPVIVVSLIQELIHRDGLRLSLGGRDDISLEPLARFLVENLTNPRYTKLLVDVSHIVLDMYWQVIGQSTIIDELFTRLRLKIDQELQVQKRLIEVLGMLETVFSSSV